MLTSSHHMMRIGARFHSCVVPGSLGSFNATQSAIHSTLQVPSICRHRPVPLKLTSVTLPLSAVRAASTTETAPVKSENSLSSNSSTPPPPVKKRAMWNRGDSNNKSNAITNAHKSAAEPVKREKIGTELADRFRSNKNDVGMQRWRPRRIVRTKNKSALRIEWTYDENDVVQYSGGNDRRQDQVGMEDADAYKDKIYTISAELMRAYTPSTERQGIATLVYGKRGLTITDLYIVGNYALRITFDDGHDTGIYPYSMLWDLGHHKREIMREYITALNAAGKRREKPIPVDTSTQEKNKRLTSGAAPHQHKHHHH